MSSCGKIKDNLFLYSTISLPNFIEKYKRKDRHKIDPISLENVSQITVKKTLNAPGASPRRCGAPVAMLVYYLTKASR